MGGPLCGLSRPTVGALWPQTFVALVILLLNPESSISKSLIRRIGLTQVVDFHDFSGYF